MREPFWRRFIIAKLGCDGVERLQVIYVDARGVYVHDRIAATGCSRKVSASAQSIVELAHKIGSAGFYLAHNHPSGSARPSKTDIISTIQLIERTLDHGLYFRDHLIVAGDCFFSLRKGRLL